MGRFAFTSVLVALALSAGATVTARAAGSAKQGEQIYVRCQACHALSYDRVGPRHCGLIGRRAGGVEHFTYSPAMKKSNIVWTEKALDRFLAAPLSVVPGTTMTYVGVPDARDRADLIAYIRQAGNSAECGK